MLEYDQFTLELALGPCTFASKSESGFLSVIKMELDSYMTVNKGGTAINSLVPFQGWGFFVFN